MAESEPLIAAISDRLGGRAALGTEVRSEADLAHVISKRISLRSFEHVLRHKTFSKDELYLIVIAARTFSHRKQKRERLTVDESDRLVRITRIQALAEDVLGDPEKAKRWLREPLGELGGSSPLDFARTESGARVVERILAAIDWGAAA